MLLILPLGCPLAPGWRTGAGSVREDAALSCQRNGTQLTSLRRFVLALILAADGPLTAYQLLDQLKQTRKSAMPPTIYRALDFLIANRLVHRLERLNAFIPCSDAGHGHGAHDVQFLICGQCGLVAEIEDHAVTAACTGPPQNPASTAAMQWSNETVSAPPPNPA